MWQWLYPGKCRHIVDDMVKGMFGTIVQGYLKNGYNRVTAEMMAREFFRYES